MLSYPCPKSLNKKSLIFLFCVIYVFFVQGLGDASAFLFPAKKDKVLTSLQEQARVYRSNGYESQRIGDLDSAIVFYQKAVQVDPSYAVAYNDLGVVYEAKGLIERAQESYLKAIELDPNYLSAYSNLALFYENRRDLDKAAFYWKKRADLGQPQDPWTKKAKQRLIDVRLALSGSPIEDIREQEVIEFMREINSQKAMFRQDDLALSRKHFDKAKKSYNKDDYATALKEALDAQYLDPTNQEIEEFIGKVRVRLISK